MPRGKIYTLVNIINIREEERKKRKNSREIYSGGLIGAVGPVRRNINGKQRKSVANVVADLVVGYHTYLANTGPNSPLRARPNIEQTLTGERRRLADHPMCLAGCKSRVIASLIQSRSSQKVVIYHTGYHKSVRVTILQDAL